MNLGQTAMCINFFLNLMYVVRVTQIFLSISTNFFNIYVLSNTVTIDGTEFATSWHHHQSGYMKYWEKSNIRQNRFFEMFSNKAWCDENPMHDWNDECGRRTLLHLLGKVNHFYFIIESTT